jgi:hypothetical protein
MADQEPYDVNDVKEKRNKTARSQYYGNHLETSTGRAMTQ